MNTSSGRSRWRFHLGAAALLGAAVAVGLLVSSGAVSEGRVAAPHPASAPGAQSGGGTGPLTIVAMGDSVPAASSCGCAGYVEQLGDLLEPITRRPSVVHNDAVGGWTSADVEDDLADAGTRADLSDADLVVLEVGANDFDLGRVGDATCFPAAVSRCWADTLAALRSGLLRIIPGIRALDHNPRLSIAVAGYWNVTVDGKVGRALGRDFVAGSDDLTKVVNATIADVAGQTGAVYIDAYAPLKGASGARDPSTDLQADGDHPNASGNALLARSALHALVAAGAVSEWVAR